MPHKDPEVLRAYRAAYRASHKEYLRAYRETHKEQAAITRRAYYVAHAEEARAYARLYHSTNANEETRERARKRANAHYEANKERAHAYGAAYIAVHREQVRAYQRHYQSGRRTRKRGLPDTFTTAEQAFCRAYFSFACAACGNEEGFQWMISMDHWIPVSSLACPGTIATNMIPLCHGVGGCNNSKHDKDPESWLIERFGTRKAAMILKKIHAYFAIVAAEEADA